MSFACTACCVLRRSAFTAPSDADAIAKWLPPNGFTCKVDPLDAQVGGNYRMTFTDFFSGNGHSFGGAYKKLVPGERIRYNDGFEDPDLSGEMTTTITLHTVSCGTEIHVVQEDLMLLGKLVEAEIPD